MPSPVWPLSTHSDVRDELLAAWDRDGYHDLLHLTEVLDRCERLVASRPEVELLSVRRRYHGEHDD